MRINPEDFTMEMPAEEGKKGVKSATGYEAVMADIEANMIAAQKYTPNVCPRGSPIFIRCKINGQSIAAMVDTGAEINAMTVGCAKRCGVLGLINTEFSSDITGVAGHSQSFGQISFCQVKIENEVLYATFSVVPLIDVDMILGMRFLKSYQCSIDMTRKCLDFDSIRIRTSTQFLQDDCCNQIETEEFDAESIQLLNQARQHQMDANHKRAEAAGHLNHIPPLNMTFLVNGHPVNALVDSGSITTFLSKSCAKQVGVFKLTDTGCFENYVGVTPIKTFGRVHFCPIEINDIILHTSVGIMDMEDDMILGLDVLNHFHCTINLKNNYIFFERSSTRVDSKEEPAPSKRSLCSTRIDSKEEPAPSNRSLCNIITNSFFGLLSW